MLFVQSGSSVALMLTLHKPTVTLQINRTTSVTTASGEARQLFQTCDWLACAPPRITLLVYCLIANSAAATYSEAGLLKSVLVRCMLGVARVCSAVSNMDSPPCAPAS
jgi:hypothetical protein